MTVIARCSIDMKFSTLAVELIFNVYLQNLKYMSKALNAFPELSIVYSLDMKYQFYRLAKWHLVVADRMVFKENMYWILKFFYYLTLGTDH